MYRQELVRGNSHLSSNAFPGHVGQPGLVDIEGKFPEIPRILACFSESEWGLNYMQRHDEHTTSLRQGDMPKNILIHRPLVVVVVVFVFIRG